MCPKCVQFQLDWNVLVHSLLMLWVGLLTICTRIPTCNTLSFHMYTHTWPTSTPPLLTSFHTQLHSHTLSRLPRSHVTYTGEHRGQCDGRIWRKISSFHETTIQCESLVGLKLLPWKQGRFEEAVEVAILSTDMSWVGYTHFFWTCITSGLHCCDY